MGLIVVDVDVDVDVVVVVVLVVGLRGGAHCGTFSPRFRLHVLVPPAPQTVAHARTDDWEPRGTYSIYLEYLALGTEYLQAP